MPRHDLSLATPEETLAFLAHIDTLLELLAARLSRIVLAGALTDEQRMHLQFSLATIDGLCGLFRTEYARQSRGATEQGR